MHICEATLMEDHFFQLCFAKDKKYIQEVINPIFEQLGFPPAVIEEIRIQESEVFVSGRGVRFDAVANDSEGNFFNIEVQKTKDKALPKRGRYYAGALDANNFQDPEGYKNLKKAFVIFITD